jgi:hypothetical protein
MPRVWLTSSYSNPSGNCVEVARPAEVLVRDSKNRDAGHLTFTAEAWTAFITDVKNEGRLRAK